MKFKRFFCLGIVIAMMAVDVCSVTANDFADYSYMYSAGTSEVISNYKSRAEALTKEFDDGLNNWMSQWDMNKGSGEIYSKWDVLLNDVYSYLKSTMSGNKFEALRQEELQWIKEKENAIYEAGKEYEGGSLQVLDENSVGIRYTSERVYYLISLIENPNGNSDIKIFFNGSELKFSQTPYIEDGTTMVPMRVIFEALGAEVVWNSSAKTVTASKNGKEVVLVVGSQMAYVNNSSTKLAKAPVLKDGTTMVPLRFVSEAFGADVNYNASTKRIDINN